MPKSIAVIDHLGLRKDSERYKEFKIGTTVHKRYSPKAIEKINLALQQESADAIWAKRHPKAVAP
jgi:hypothetical protein